MAGRTPFEALLNHAAPLNEALGCITPRRLAVPPKGRVRVGTVYALTLGRGGPILLKGHAPTRLSAAQRYVIVPDDDPERGPFRVRTVEYFYLFETLGGQEILAFHWTPETPDPNQRRYPHLHVGSAMVDPASPFLPDRFSDLHIPTGRVAIEDVVRFAHHELGVPWIKKDAEAILDANLAAFERQRTRSR